MVSWSLQSIAFFPLSCSMISNLTRTFRIKDVWQCPWGFLKRHCRIIKRCNNPALKKSLPKDIGFASPWKPWFASLGAFCLDCLDNQVEALNSKWNRILVFEFLSTVTISDPIQGFEVGRLKMMCDAKILFSVEHEDVSATWLLVDYCEVSWISSELTCIDWVGFKFGNEITERRLRMKP